NEREEPGIHSGGVSDWFLPRSGLPRVQTGSEAAHGDRTCQEPSPARAGCLSRSVVSGAVGFIGSIGHGTPHLFRLLFEIHRGCTPPHHGPGLPPASGDPLSCDQQLSAVSDLPEALDLGARWKLPLFNGRVVVRRWE